MAPASQAALEANHRRHQHYYLLIGHRICNRVACEGRVDTSDDGLVDASSGGSDRVSLQLPMDF